MYNSTKKSISKSVRLSEEVYDYINNYQGNGFNEKFQNIILYAKRTEQERRKRLEHLNDLLKQKEEEYSHISSVVDDYYDILRPLSFYLRNIQSNIDSLSDFFDLVELILAELEEKRSQNK